MIRGGDFISKGNRVLWARSLDGQDPQSSLAPTSSLDGDGDAAAAVLARCVSRGLYSDLWSSMVRTTDGYAALSEPDEANYNTSPAFCLLCLVIEVDSDRALLSVPEMESSQWVPLSALRAFDPRDCDSVVVGEVLLASYGHSSLREVYTPCRVLRLSGERVSLQVLTDIEIERIDAGACRLRLSDAASGSGSTTSTAALLVSDCRFAALVEGGGLPQHGQQGRTPGDRSDFSMSSSASAGNWPL